MPPFTPDRLLRIRRVRKARFLWEKLPLLAFEEMRQQYSNYSYNQFLDDLRRRSARRKKKIKTPLDRFGRYGEMKRLASLFQETGDVKAGIRANQLRKVLTKPYRVRIRIGGKTWEFTYPPTIAYKAISSFVNAASRCPTWVDFDILEAQFSAYLHIPG